MSGPIVVKIGGSTLGAEDTSLEDLVALQQAGRPPIAVHGGGALITDWLARLGVESEFVDGLRSTNEEALRVVIAVLRGVVNTELVASIGALGGRAVGLCGVDGVTISAERYDERLGFVGRITGVDGALLEAVADSGAIPVVAPIGIESPGQPLNINADTVAGEVARAVEAEQLIFLTDVDGLMDAEGRVIAEIDAQQTDSLRQAGTLAGGMIPKVEACLRAAELGTVARIANGRLSGTLRRIIDGEQVGTRVGGLALWDSSTSARTTASRPTHSRSAGAASSDHRSHCAGSDSARRYSYSSSSPTSASLSTSTGSGSTRSPTWTSSARS